MAMVAAVGLGSMQTHHHLVPVPILTQGFGPPCHSANGQPIQLPHHFLSLIHRVKAMDPKHDLHLDFQGQHMAKRFVPRIHQPSAVHDDNSVKHGMGSLRAGLPYSWIPGTNHSLAPGLEVHPKKCTHGGYPLESPLMVNFPHVISLHQSAPLIESLNPVARSM